MWIPTFGGVASYSASFSFVLVSHLRLFLQYKKKDANPLDMFQILSQFFFFVLFLPLKQNS
jgi:hypothetical protein